MQMTICYVYATFTKFGEFYLWDSVQQNIEKKMKKVLFGHYQALISFFQRALLPPYTHTPFSALYRALKARSKKKKSHRVPPYFTLLSYLQSLDTQCLFAKMAPLPAITIDQRPRKHIFFWFPGEATEFCQLWSIDTAVCNDLLQ